LLLEKRVVRESRRVKLPIKADVHGAFSSFLVFAAVGRWIVCALLLFAVSVVVFLFDFDFAVIVIAVVVVLVSFVPFTSELYK